MAEETANQVVLVVEDDDSIREIVCRVLEDEGYVTHTANNGVRGSLFSMFVRNSCFSLWISIKAARLINSVMPSAMPNDEMKVVLHML